MAADASPAGDEGLDELGSLFTLALSLGVLTSPEADKLTDALASGATTEEAILAEYGPLCEGAACEGADAECGDEEYDDDGAASATGASLGVIIDLHFLQVAASSFSLATAWSVHAFEAALVEACGGGGIACRYACDSELDVDRLPPTPLGKGGSPGGGGAKAEHGKARLHAQMREAGYTLILSPNKGSGSRGQGATDIDVACRIFEVGGAFAAAPAAQLLVLVAGDADFRPAIEAVTAARPTLRVAVVAERSLLAKAYLAWIAASDAVSHVELGTLLGRVAPSVVDMRGRGRPARADGSGRADAAACAAACADAAARCEGGERVTLNVSGFGEPSWADGETGELVDALCASGSAAAALGGLWLHHTAIGDGSCEALCRLLPHAPLMNELHLSDSAVTLEGVRLLVDAARACGERPRRLYINVRHLSGPEAIALAKEAADVAIIKLTDANRLRALAAAAGGKGRGRGAGAAHGGRAGGATRADGFYAAKGAGAGKGKGKGGAAKGKGGPGKGKGRGR